MKLYDPLVTASKLNELMKEVGITRNQLAEEVSLSSMAVWYHLRGEKQTLDNLNIYATFFGVNITDLF